MPIHPSRQYGGAGVQSSGGGWSTQKKLKTGEPNQVGTLQASFPVAGNYTVEFAMDLTEPLSAVKIPPRAEATVTWSIEGNSVSRRISLGNGVSIQGAAEAISVSVKDSTILFPGDVPTEYTVTMQVAPGTRPTVSQPPTLVENGGTNGKVQSLPAASSFILPVPQDAGPISLMVTALSLTSPQPIVGDIQVRQLDSAGSILKVYDPREYNFVPLSAGCQQIEVANISAIDVLTSITYGIDG